MIVDRGFPLQRTSNIEQAVEQILDMLLIWDAIALIWRHCNICCQHRISRLYAQWWLISGPIYYDDVIKWKHFPCYWRFVQGIHRSPVNSTHKGQWRESLMFSLNCVWTNGWINNRDAGDLKRHRAHYDDDCNVYRITTWSVDMILWYWYFTSFFNSNIFYCHIIYKPTTIAWVV